MWKTDNPEISTEACMASVNAIKDALYVLNGKWKLLVIAALASGPKRFGELQRALEGITPRVLSAELRELELNELVTRKVYPTVPVTVTYQLSEHSHSPGQVMESLRLFGMEHKRHIMTAHRMNGHAND